MRAINHLRKRFEFAIRDKKPIYVNQNDVDALNQLIEFTNTGKDTNLEDALILLFILQYWRTQNNDNKQYTGVLKIDSISVVFQKLCMLVNSKAMIIDEITTELQANQKMNGETNLIQYSDVERLLNDSISVVKEMKPLNILDRLKHEYPAVTDR
ncbi:hypothetical protein HZQ12_17795 [Elizabethkingia anophelis]|uniref:hypothetical protein n=1 Tax=Elizabethkingia anophelis TaxID=1117645 RepID=UPI0021A8B00F|nr:hypothetical protein [Elizabethkingia anophelis]MCT3978754.1 hypothetical protein [Elizabethkingia anophelis]MCT4042809.1 hypothetical protein [Elizabethkingia anophelis]